MSSRSLWLVLPCAAVLALTGCGGDPETTTAADSPATSPSTDATGPSATATPTITASPTATPSPTLTPTSTAPAPDQTTQSKPTDEPPTETPGDETPPPPEEPPTDEPPTDDPDGDGPKDNSNEDRESTDRAITRFEAFLHAVGDKDIATMCEIAAPAAAEIEDAGYGDCETNMTAMADQPTEAQSAALREASVDPGGVDTSNPEGVIIPATAVEASEEFNAENLGDFKLSYQGDDWYIVV